MIFAPSPRCISAAITPFKLWMGRFYFGVMDIVLLVVIVFVAWRVYGS